MNPRLIYDYLRRNPGKFRKLVRRGLHRRLRDNPKSYTPGTLPNLLAEKMSQPLWDAFTDRVRGFLAYAAPLRRPNPAVKLGTAYVMMLRGMSTQHLFHHYLIGVALERLGYEVKHVICTGQVEGCSFVTWIGDQTADVPFACGQCRAGNDLYREGGFETLDLNDYVSPEENRQAARLAELPWEEFKNLEVDGVPILEVLHPHIMRSTHGLDPQTLSAHPKMRLHMLASWRYLQRFREFVRARAEKPALVVFYNGTFMPEGVLQDWCQRQEIPFLSTERGWRLNTIYMARDSQGCFYDASRAWESRDRSRDPERLAVATATLEERLRTLANPHGEKRELAFFDKAQLEALGTDGFTIFFCSVSHDSASMMKTHGGLYFLEGLEKLCHKAIEHDSTLVVRCHPDEFDAGFPSAYPVKKFLEDRGIVPHPRIVLIPPHERWNPYLLSREARAVVMHNGSLGTELAGQGYRIYNLGKSHYAGKGFTSDVRTDADFDAIFTQPKAFLTPEEQQTALTYYRFFVGECALAHDAFFREPKRLNVEITPDSTPEAREGQVADLTAFLDRLLADLRTR
jgi:hypothetical protein